MKRRSRREARAPDTRPKWDDPDLPVLLQIEEDGTRKLEAFPPTEVRQYMKILHEINPEPNWRDDPTYNLQRKK